MSKSTKVGFNKIYSTHLKVFTYISKIRFLLFSISFFSRLFRERKIPRISPGLCLSPSLPPFLYKHTKHGNPFSNSFLTSITHTSGSGCGPETIYLQRHQSICQHPFEIGQQQPSAFSMGDFLLCDSSISSCKNK
jgi:hypothetical protein